MVDNLSHRAENNHVYRDRTYPCPDSFSLGKIFLNGQPGVLKSMLVQDFRIDVLPVDDYIPRV